MPVSIDTLIGLAAGLGLAAACGFRVFAPLLVLSLAARHEHVTLAQGFGWMASDASLVTFGAATVIEALAYMVPWLDHALDLVASPAAVAAGMVAAASVLTDLPPLIVWTTAAVGGGGLAALVQGSTIALRAASSATTMAVGNPVVALIELAGALVTSVAAIVAPFALGVLVLFFVWWAWRWLGRLRGGRGTVTSIG